MVTHDVEFAAGVSDRCGLFFDHEITSVDTPEEFFCNNNYYTTEPRRETTVMTKKERAQLETLKAQLVTSFR